MTKLVLAVVALATASVLTLAGPGASTPGAECPPGDEASLAAAACSNVPIVPTLDPEYSQSFVPPPPTQAAGRVRAAAEAPSGAEPGCRPLQAVFYAQTDWFRLAQKLRGNASACADYYISVPPLAADKTKPRPNEAQRIRALGPQMHAMADIQFTAWGNWVTTNNATWFDAGVEARRRMHSAGYDVTLGDLWALNELPSSVRRGDGDARANARDFSRGLYLGDGATPPTAGLVWTVGLGQPTADLSVYKRNLKSWLRDGEFWADMSLYVRFWSQEVYPDARRWGVPGADLQTRRDALNDYLQHAAALADVSPEELAEPRDYLRQAYTPLASAAWQWTSGFGFTAVSPLQMQHFVSSQTYAMRNFSGLSPWRSEDTFGFAWAPDNPGLPTADFARQTGEILDRLAAAIHDSDGGSGDGQADDVGLGACGELQEWCDTDVEGATFNPAWKLLFGAWNYAPVAQDAVVTVDEDGSVGMSLVATDLDRDPLTRMVVDPPAHGTLTGTPLALTYTPASDFNGADSFTFRADDGEAKSELATVSVTVNPINDPPTVGLRAAGPVDEGAVSASLTADGLDSDGDELFYTWDSTVGTIVGTAAIASLRVDDGPAVAHVTVSVSDSRGVSASASRDVEVRNVAPRVDAGGDRSGAWGVPLELSGVVTDPSTADASAGLQPTWTFGDGSPSTPGTKASHAYDLPGVYTATLTAADKDGASATDEASVAIVPRPAEIVYDGPSGLPALGAEVSARLLDRADPGSARLGGHALRLALGSQSCNATTNQAGVARCTLGASPLPLGPASLEITLSGDGLYQSSSLAKDVVLYALPDGGTFVVGDLTANGVVTFWSPLWSKANQLSGGAAPASFLGFAFEPAGVTCGAMWKALPLGLGAPAEVPAYMAVVVAGTVTRSGLTIVGDSARIVVVRTDRYRRLGIGRGTVVASVC